MNARDAILGRIRAAVADLPADPVEVPRAYLRSAPGITPGDRTVTIELFTERLQEYGATVRRVPETDLPAAVADALDERSARSAVVPDGFPAAWLGKWSGVILREDPPLSKAELDATDAVVTMCAAAIADSGTIVLDAGPGQGRRAPTLVPDTHVCVVREDQVGSSMPEVITLLDPRRPITWISGPSATADIEMIRVEGVHGPRKLTVLITT
ncbi:LutC/YkgG family protein [Streptomyces gibsoniae]|uniref:LUD domain-containing protein n=1 Tax=Streptomyces gibsoniae TaxID=3075529 RepID=A0ABU2U3Y8_9ACTN|nr:LUD domain-containing protein [Streptomyces sp. DSM 41699]MDT0467948.1 LUD domain-containing protein [Streptomyces sp. DSM 41699]